MCVVKNNAGALLVNKVLGFKRGEIIVTSDIQNKHQNYQTCSCLKYCGSFLRSSEVVLLYMYFEGKKRR